MLDNVEMLRADPLDRKRSGEYPTGLGTLVDVEVLGAIAAEFVGVLDYMSIGIVITDVSCTSVMINRYANEVLCEKDGLFLDRNCVKAASAKTNRELRAAMDAATKGDNGHRYALSVDRPSCLAPLMVLVAPVGKQAAAVYINDPERKTSIDPVLISELFGLTPAESAVASLVVEGMRVSEIAEILNISIHTARCHLKHVFSKTGTERQAELAGYIGSLLGKVNLGEGDASRHPASRTSSQRTRVVHGARS